MNELSFILFVIITERLQERIEYKIVSLDAADIVVTRLAPAYAHTRKSYNVKGKKEKEKKKKRKKEKTTSERKNHVHESLLRFFLSRPSSPIVHHRSPKLAYGKREKKERAIRGMSTFLNEKNILLFFPSGREDMRSRGKKTNEREAWNLRIDESIRYRIDEGSSLFSAPVRRFIFFIISHFQFLATFCHYLFFPRYRSFCSFL